MLELLKESLKRITFICEVGKEDDVVLWSCAEGNMGKIYVNTIDNPTCAIVAGALF